MGEGMGLPEASGLANCQASGRDGDAGVGLVVAVGEKGFGRVQGGGCVGAGVSVAAEGHGDYRGGRVELCEGVAGGELGADGARDGRAVHGGDREPHGHTVVTSEDISLPARPEDCVAPTHEEAVSGVCHAVGIINLGGVVEEMDEELGAAVVDVVDQASVALGHVDGFEHEEVSRVFDEAVGIALGVFDVDDGGEGRGVRVHCEVDAADELFVGADVSEVDASGEGGAGVDLESDLGGGWIHARV